MGSIVKSICSSIIGAINAWWQAKKAAHAKAKADAMGTREESAERAEKAEYNIDTAAKAEKDKPTAADDDGKLDEIAEFLKEGLE